MSSVRVASVALLVFYAFNVSVIHRLTSGGYDGDGSAGNGFGVPDSGSTRGVRGGGGHLSSSRGGDLDEGIRISFSLHDPSVVQPPDAFSSRREYLCRDRPPPPPPLNVRAMLNFTVTIRTDLRVGFVGDSISAQFSQAFDAAALGGVGREYDLTNFDKSTGDVQSKVHERRWTQEAFRNPDLGRISECLTVASPLDGGGSSAFLRVFDKMSRSNMRDAYACNKRTNHALGWSPRQTESLKSRVGGDFDAFVMRLTHGWLTLDQITREMIVEQIELISEHLGAETIVISTLPMCNNARTAEDWRKISEINQMVRDLANTWIPPTQGERGVRTVLVQEFGNFTSQLVWTNARHLGYHDFEDDEPDFARRGWELDDAAFLFEQRLSGQGNWSPSKPHVCSTKDTWTDDRGRAQCHLNGLSVDGSHWCQNNLGPRHSASLACLLGCVYNDGKVVWGKGRAEVRACERECNDRSCQWCLLKRVGLRAARPCFRVDDTVG